MTEQMLIKRCARGDPQAWEMFLTRYTRLIYFSIRSVLRAYGLYDGFSEAEVADLFQEMLSSLMEDGCSRLKSFRGHNGCSFASWLRQVAMNATVSRMRSLRKLLPFDEEADEEALYRSAAAYLTPSLKDQVAAREELERLADCIARLQARDKYFIELHLNQRLAIVKMQRLMRATAAALYMRKRRIIRQLKDCFEAKGASVGLS